jgi:prepilin-type N-terminal cleavage/methylation domain-containing protein/prepilin-type processing-associated H-X9-DG protein
MKDQKHTAFTLIELLVVIAIIAILASLMMVGFARASKLGTRTVCESQLRQLTLAWMSYAYENNSHLVPDRTEGTPTRSTADSWVVGSVRYTDAPGIEAGALFPFTRSAAVYHCPADHSVNRTSSMNPGMNWFDDSIFQDPLPTSQMVRTLDQICKPIVTFVFIDENENSVDDGFFGVALPLVQGNEWINVPGTRHDLRKTPLSYADGHVEEIKWRTPKPFEDYNEPVAGPDDLADLNLMRSRVLPQP